MTPGAITQQDTFETFAPSRRRTERVQRVHPAAWIFAFVLIEIVCQLALLSSAIGPFRQPARTLAFGMSLLWLVVLFRRTQQHPAVKAAVFVLIILALELTFHPNTNTLRAGVAQVMLYAAILAPVIWTTSLAIDGATFRKLILLLWSFHVLSSAVGILQVYFPGRFQPNLSSAVRALGSTYVRGLEIETAKGNRVFRPMGLTDLPGGAAVAGVYAGLFGIGFLLSERKSAMRWLALASVLAGLACIYLCQVRVYVIMFGLCALVLCVVLVLRRDTKRLTAILVVVPLLIGLSFVWAFSLGGRNMLERLQTLVKDDPGKVYYKSRGLYLEHTAQEMAPKYYLGAGLGRWGMVNSYFGNTGDDPARGRIWVEVQWTGWLLDGGFPLVLGYSVALGIAIWTTLRIARLRGAGPIWIWGAIVLAYDVGILALTFGSIPFIGQQGMEFWMLNAALFTAARTEIARRKELAAAA